MSAVPPAPATTAPLPAAPLPQAVASVSAAPQALLTLPAGTVLQAQVLETASRGALTIDTALGILTLKTSLPLPAGSTLTLQTNGNLADTALLRITSLDGKSLAQGVTNLLAKGRLVNSAPSAASLATTAPPVHGAVSSGQSLGTLTSPFQATVLRGAAGIATGSGLTLRLNTLSQTPVTAGGNPTANTPTTGAPNAAGQNQLGGRSQTPGFPQGTNTSGPAGSTPGTVGSGGIPGTPPPPGSQAAANLAGQGSSTATPAPTGHHGQHPSNAAIGAQATGQRSLVGQTITGTVTNTAAGTTMVQSSAGLLTLGNRVDLPPGAQVSLNVLAQSLPPSATNQPLPPLSGMQLGSSSSGQPPSAWPTLSDSLDLLARVDPQAARQLANIIPANDPRLVANTVAYNQALRSNDPGRWMPASVISALEKAGGKGPQLAERLGGELRELSARAKHPQPGGGEWRTLSMPFADGAGISQINIITRRLSPEDDSESSSKTKKGGGKGHRFLIDLSLSNLGDLQFDGLYKKGSRTLELIIRSRQELPGRIRQSINGLFACNSQVLNIAGGVTFRVTDQFAGPPPGAATALADEITLPQDQSLTVPVVPHGGWTA